MLSIFMCSSWVTIFLIFISGLFLDTRILPASSGDIRCLNGLIGQMEVENMNQEKGQGPIYREVQRFRQNWLWAVVLAIAGLQWYAAVE